MIEEQEVIAEETPAIPEDNIWDGDSVEPNDETPPIELEPMDQAHLQENEEVQQPQNTEGTPDLTEEQRFQYWQSKHDQKASELDAMSDKLKGYDDIAPIADYIQNNPSVLKSVARSLSGDDPSVPSQEKSMESLKKPTRPTKPGNYDTTEAVMDTESDSYKYRMAMEDYRDQMIDFQENRELQRQEEYKQREAALVEQRRAYQAEQQTVSMKQQLMNQYGYTPDRADEFVTYYSSPDSITLDNLVNLDKMRYSPSQQEVATRQKAQTMASRSEMAKVPTPAGIVSGQPEPQMTDEDIFNMGLMSNKR